MNRRVTFYASLGWVNDKREETVDMVSDAGYDDWDDMSVEDQEKACADYFENFLANILDSGWYEA